MDILLCYVKKNMRTLLFSLKPMDFDVLLYCKIYTHNGTSIIDSVLAYREEMVVNMLLDWRQQAYWSLKEPTK